MKRGFTLIEVLVVVLIIGILATIAIPQYRKSILKARMVEVYVMMDSIRNACSLHRAEEGFNPSEISWLPPTSPSYHVNEQRWGLNVQWPSYEAFTPSSVSCNLVTWADSRVFDGYECALNPRTGKFCCLPEGLVHETGKEEGEFFIKNMSQQYTSCQGMYAGY